MAVTLPIRCRKVSDVLIVCIAAIAFSAKQAVWGMGGSSSVSARRFRCSVTGGFSKLVFFLLLGTGGKFVDADQK